MLLRYIEGDSSNSQTVNQFTEAAGKQSSNDSNERQYQRTIAWHIPVPAWHEPTDAEQQNYDDLAATMQQPDALRAGVAGNRSSVDQSESSQLGCLEPTRLPNQSGEDQAGTLRTQPAMQRSSQSPISPPSGS